MPPRLEARRWPWAFALILTVMTLARLGELAVFMVKPDYSHRAVAPVVRDLDDDSLEEPFFPKHSCFTSYVVATELAEQRVDNIYLREHYKEPENPSRVHEEIGDLLKIDQYQYPPVFLILPWLLSKVGGGFFGARALFFFLNLMALVGASWGLSRWSGKRSWILAPFVLGTTATLTTLQIGNVQALVMVASVSAMLAFERGRVLTGAALLGFVTASKIFPGLLLVYLLARGRYRAVAWTLTAALAFCGLSLALFGPQSWAAFFDYQLPRLASGEAFSFAFEYARPILVNSSVAGIPHKLRALGILSDAQTAAQAATWLFGFAVIALAAWSGRRTKDDAAATETERLRELGRWLALLLLAQMRSPFLPWEYGNFVVLWLVGALVVGSDRPRTWLAGAAAWIAFGVALPLPAGGGTLALDLALTLIAQGVALALAAGVLWRGSSDRAHAVVP